MLVERIIKVGDSLGLLAFLRLNAGISEGVVKYSKQEIAKLFGYSTHTLDKRLSAISDYVEVTGGIIRTRPISPTDTLAALTAENCKVRTTTELVDGSAVLRRWSTKYKERYGVPYKYQNYPTTLRAIQSVIRKHRDDSLALVDYVIDNYETIWSNPQYPKPTINAFISWIADKAIDHVKREQASQTNEVIAGDDGSYL